MVSPAANAVPSIALPAQVGETFAQRARFSDARDPRSSRHRSATTTRCTTTSPPRAPPATPA